METIDVREPPSAASEQAEFELMKVANDERLTSLDRLWKAVYRAELGWFASDEITLFGDEFHSSSIYLEATLARQPVGLLRLVRRETAGLPVERFADLCGLIPDRDARVIECQRLVVLDRYRSYKSPMAPFGIWPALMKATLQLCLRDSITHMIADCFLDTPTTPIKSLKRIGFKETGLAFTDTELNVASMSTVLTLDIRDMLRVLYQTGNDFAKYILSIDDHISL